MVTTRRVIFASDEVYWQCQCNLWYEELALNAEMNEYINPRLYTILAGFPDVNSLSHIIGEYNTRVLTYEEDALPAITGLLTLISRCFPGGFLFGLPEMCFEQGLVWPPYWDHTNLKRRTAPSRSPTETASCAAALPSWSWIGWQGLVNIPDDAARINALKSEIQETFPVTAWFCGQTPTTPPHERRRIRSTWYEERAKRKEAADPLPPGWTRHDLSTAMLPDREEPALYPVGCEKYVYRHPAINDDDASSNAWYYPFPVTDIQPSTPSFMPPQWPYLFCTTQSVHLRAQSAESTNMLTLCDDAGYAVGVLHLHNQEARALFTAAREVELVAVCRTVYYSKTFDEERQRYGLPITETETVRVLWVVWENGVAFRRAVGHVDADEWAKLSVKEIDLVLG